MIGGLGAVLKTQGTNVADMLVRNESCLRMTMGSEPASGNRAMRGGTPQSIYYRRPTTRMGVVWAVREAFYQAKEYEERKTVGPDAGPVEKVSHAVRQGAAGVGDLPRGKVFARAEPAERVAQAVDLPGVQRGAEPPVFVVGPRIAHRHRLVERMIEPGSWAITL